MRTPGLKLNLAIQRLDILSETERNPKKLKIDKKTTLFDLLTLDVLQIINKMHGRLVYQENFSVAVV